MEAVIMFMDFGDQPPPPPWQPKQPDRRPALNAGQRKTLAIVVAMNLLLLLVAPIGGATLISALIAWLS
jgi:hypothetical protein